MRKKLWSAVAGTMLVGSALLATPAAAAPPSDPGVVTDNGDGTSTITQSDGATFTSDTGPTAGVAGLATTLAGGSFTWTASFDTAVFSRKWETSAVGDVWVNIDSISNCVDGQAKLELERATGVSYVKVGTTRTVSCDGGNYVWRSVSKAGYRFQLYETGSAGDGYFDHEASGSVSYT